MEDQLALWATFLAYLLIVLGIGFAAWRRTRNASDYFLGGRRLSPAVAALSAGASDMSGWVLLGLPGAAYASGLEAGWIALGLCLGVGLNWWLTASRLRVYSQQLGDAVTLPVYLQRRFADEGVLLRVLATGFILLFFLFYVASGLIGGGKLFVATFGVPYHGAVLLGAGAIIVYTVFGGFLAVSWTDVFQAALMSAALLAVPLAVMIDAGSVGGFAERVRAIDPNLLDPLRGSSGEPLGLLAIVSLLGWGLAYFGQPHILACFKAIGSHHDVPRAAAVGLAWAVFIYVAAVAVGLSGLVLLGENLGDAEHVFMALVRALFHPLVAGILLAAILAAIMSTVDSQLLVSSSALAEDLYPLLAREALNPVERMRLGRVAVVVLAVAATGLAMDEDSKVLDVVAYAWAGLGAALGPAVLVSLYWPRMNRQGALAGVVTGGLTVIVWRQLEGGLFALYELVPGFLLAVAAIVAVSLATAPPPAAVRQHWQAMRAEHTAARRSQ